MAEQETLDELVERFIEIGAKDPHEGARTLMRHLGDRLLATAESHLEEFIAEMFRQRLAGKRRQAIARVTPKAIGSREIMIKSIWIPLAGGDFKYIAVGDCTHPDFDARAAYIDRLIAGIVRHNDWNRAMSAQIRREGVTYARELRDVPTLEEAESPAVAALTDGRD